LKRPPMAMKQWNLGTHARGNTATMGCTIGHWLMLGSFAHRSSLESALG
jgi:hypothetical protein